MAPPAQIMGQPFMQEEARATFSMPEVTFKKATESLLAPSAATSPVHSPQLRLSALPVVNPGTHAGFSTAGSSNYSSVAPQDEPVASSSPTVFNDYFSWKNSSKKSRNRNSSTFRSVPEPHARKDFDHHIEMARLLEDALIMARGGAGRWKRIAITMPQSMWKREADAETCDHLLINSRCDKRFGNFIGTLRIPSAWTAVNATISRRGSATSLASSEGGASSSAAGSRVTALIPSLKSERINTCWRCGSCFCDEHSNHFATLVLDPEDAPAPQTPRPESRKLSEEEKAAHDVLQTIFGAMNSDGAAAQPKSTLTATEALQQNLAGRLALSQHFRRSDSKESSSVTGSHPGSSGSDEWQSIMEEPRPHVRFQSADTSLQSSLAPSFTTSSAQRAAISVPFTLESSEDSASTPRTRQGSSSISVPSSNSPQTAAEQPISSRMIRLHDGRYLIRERVCPRCSNIVEQAKARTIHKQDNAYRNAMRQEHQSDYWEPSTGWAFGNGIASGQQSRAYLAGEEEYGTSVAREAASNAASARMRRGAGIRSRSSDAYQESTSAHRLPRTSSSPSVHNLNRPSYLRPSHRQISENAPISDDSDDEGDEVEGPALASLHRPRCMSHHFLPPMIDSQQPKPSPALPTCGMGGQRLKMALASQLRKQPANVHAR